MLHQLHGIGRGQAGELLPYGIDDEEIAVRPVVPAQADIGAGALSIGGIHLHQGGKHEEAGEGVVGFQVAEENGEVSLRQAKAVPLLAQADRKMLAGAISAAQTGLIQASIIVAAEALISIPGEAAVLRRAIGKLVAAPAVIARRNINILVQIERRSNALGKVVNDVIVGIGAVVEQGTEGRLPLLGLEHAAGVGGMEEKTFKIELAYAADAGPRFEIAVYVLRNAVIALQEADLGIEVAANLVFLGHEVEQVAAEGRRAAHIRLAAGQARGSRLRRHSRHHQVLGYHHASVQAAGLVVRVERIAGALVHPHYADIGLPEEGALDPHHPEVGVRIGAAGAGVHVHDAQVKAGQRAGDFGAPVDGHFLAGHGINADLAAEEEQIPFAIEREIEDAGVLQKKLPLLRKEELVGSEVELVDINVGIGEIGIAREVGDQV